MGTIHIGRTKYSLNTITSFPDGRLGEIDYQRRYITLATHAFNGSRFALDEREQAFWHEIVHAVLRDMRNKLEQDERFVDRFADRLTQVIKQVFNGHKLVPHVPQRLRKLPSQVSRNAGIKETSLRRNTANTLRKRTTQSSRAVRQRHAVA